MKQQITPEDADGGAAPREWDARTYHAVSEPQFEWGKRVLASLELDGNETALDAGCGTGRLTALLADRVPHGRVMAVDRSHNMATVAKETLSTRSRHVDVALADLVHLPFARAFDVVFSTATFHWVLDHETLFAELFGVLQPGGRLHAQCGGGPNLARLHHRAHVLMAMPEFAPWFVDWQEPWEYASAEVTRDRLMRAGFTEVETFVEPAPFVFPDADAYTVFISAVVLRTFLAPLVDEDSRRSFLEAIVAQAAADDPPYELDYYRLNIRARHP
jgi:trans-aconitate 2-methyltransferase